jgi:hypothetical protein
LGNAKIDHKFLSAIGCFEWLLRLGRESAPHLPRSGGWKPQVLNRSLSTLLLTDRELSTRILNRCERSRLPALEPRRLHSIFEVNSKASFVSQNRPLRVPETIALSRGVRLRHTERVHQETPVHGKEIASTQRHRPHRS